VSSSGVVSGIGNGTCTITAKASDGGFTATAAITVTPIYETAIKLNKANASLGKGKCVQLKASLTPSTTDFKAVKWASSDANIAKVDASGKVTAVQTGTCTVTATSANGKVATCKIITLPQKVTSVKASAVASAQWVGRTIQIPITVAPANADNRAITWTTSNANVATVSQDGTVTFRSGGKVTIRATAQDGSKKYASKVFTVKQLVTGIGLNTNEITLAKGKTFALKATVTPASASSKAVAWTSSNPKIVTVSASGVVKGISNGAATLTCKAKDGSGVLAQCAVTVGVATE